jgi:hypothetical protein
MLTILVPTIGRIQKLTRGIESWIRCIHTANAVDKVTLLIADNHSTDGTASYGQSLAEKYPFIRYERHLTFCPSAEESILAATQFCTTPYVWTFGDDDEVSENALTVVLEALQSTPRILFINMNCRDGDRSIPGFDVDSKIIQYPTGWPLFQNFGVTSGTTCVSSICVPLDFYKHPILKNLKSISPIYSLSCALLVWSYQYPVTLVGNRLFDYFYNVPAEEIGRISGLAESNHRLPYYYWHLGLLTLLREVSHRTEIPLSELLLMREPISRGVGSRDPLLRDYKPCIEFIAHYVDKEMNATFVDIQNRSPQLHELVINLQSAFSEWDRVDHSKSFQTIQRYLARLEYSLSVLQSRSAAGTWARLKLRWGKPFSKLDELTQSWIKESKGS